MKQIKPILQVDHSNNIIHISIHNNRTPLRGGVSCVMGLDRQIGEMSALLEGLDITYGHLPLGSEYPKNGRDY